MSFPYRKRKIPAGEHMLHNGFPLVFFSLAELRV
ncbi:hypothetical protein OROMI_017163 [Orobanche minor]